MSETKVEHRRTYAEMTVDSPNPLARYSHRARILRSINTIKRHLDPKGVFVDFGAGTGLLLYTVRQLFPGAELIGVEPHLECLFPGSARYVPSPVSYTHLFLCRIVAAVLRRRTCIIRAYPAALMNREV